MNRTSATSSTAPRPRLNQKTARQSSRFTSSAPMTGPSASDSPDTADQAPSARARCVRSGNSCRITDSVPGSEAAAPMPITARPPMTQPTDGATAHMTEPPQNTTMPAAMIHFRPSRSPSEPATNIRLANTNEYALSTHCSGMTPAPRSFWMLPSATLTIVVSRKVRKSTAKTVQSAVGRDTTRAAWAVVTASVWQSGDRAVLADRRRVALQLQQVAEGLRRDLPLAAFLDRVAMGVRQLHTATGDREGH